MPLILKLEFVKFHHNFSSSNYTLSSFSNSFSCLCIITRKVLSLSSFWVYDHWFQYSLLQPSLPAIFSALLHLTESNNSFWRVRVIRSYSFSSDSRNGEYLTDIWYYDIINNSWGLVSGDENQQYVSIGAACVHFPDFLVFFGGYKIIRIFDID